MKSKLYTIDLSILPRFAVGFDELIEDLHRMAGSVTESNYPPYNIVKYSETEYAIEVAVAGFTEEELEDFMRQIEGIKATIEILQNKELMSQIEESEENIQQGRVKKLNI